MGEESAQRRFNNNLKAAKKYLDTPKNMYTIIIINDPNCPFHLERIRKDTKKGDEVLKIRLVLDKVSDLDKKLCSEYIMSDRIFTKGILLKKYKEQDFDFIPIN